MKSFKKIHEKLKPHFSTTQIGTLLSGDAVIITLNSKKEADKIAKRFKKLGLKTEYWLSSGSHGYEDEDMLSVYI